MDGLRLVGEVVVFRATKLAREGDLRGASRLLEPHATGEDPVPSALDLLARIRVQQGFRDEAKTLWQTALALDPSEATYRDAVRRLETLGRRPLWTAAPPGWLALVVLAALPLGSWALGRSPPPAADAAPVTERERAPMPPAGPPEVTRESARTSLDNVREALRDVAGINVSDVPEGIRVTFHAGLFSEGVEMDPTVAETLFETARALEPWCEQLEVRLTGHTDEVPLRPGSRFQDNMELGMARAAAAATHMRLVGGLPGAVLTVRSLGSDDAPFANDGGARPGNRTVVVTVLPSQNTPEGGRP